MLEESHLRVSKYRGLEQAKAEETNWKFIVKIQARIKKV